MAKINVEERDGFLLVKVIGKMAQEEAQDALKDVQGRLASLSEARLVYDLRDIQVSETPEIALMAKSIHEQEAGRIARLAIVVGDYAALTRAGMAFSSLDQHRTFYDLDSAIRWVTS